MFTLKSRMRIENSNHVIDFKTILRKFKMNVSLVDEPNSSKQTQVVAKREWFNAHALVPLHVFKIVKLWSGSLGIYATTCASVHRCEIAKNLWRLSKKLFTLKLRYYEQALTHSTN